MIPAPAGGPPPLLHDWPTGAVVLVLLLGLATLAAVVSR